MSAGYLWRAAVDTSGPGTSLLVVPPAAASELAEVPFNSLDLLRPAKVEDGASVRARQVTRRVQRSARRARTAQFVSVTGPGQARQLHAAGSASFDAACEASLRTAGEGRSPRPRPRRHLLNLLHLPNLLHPRPHRRRRLPRQRRRPHRWSRRRLGRPAARHAPAGEEVTGTIATPARPGRTSASGQKESGEAATSRRAAIAVASTASRASTVRKGEEKEKGRR